MANERPGTISVEDVPDWVKMPPERYVELREQMIDQELRLVEGAAFNGSWLRLAAQTLQTIGSMAPEQGGHHHSCIIIGEALRAIYEAPNAN